MQEETNQDFIPIWEKYLLTIKDVKTSDVCRHTYCSNMAKSGMNPKTLQYLMGHSDIGVTLNTYTHLGLKDATDEVRRLDEIKSDIGIKGPEKRITRNMFKVV